MLGFSAHRREGQRKRTVHAQETKFHAELGACGLAFKSSVANTVHNTGAVGIEGSREAQRRVVFNVALRARTYTACQLPQFSVGHRSAEVYAAVERISSMA